MQTDQSISSDLIKRWMVSDEEFTLIIQNSVSYSEVLRRMGRAIVGSGYRYVKHRIKLLKLDSEHFNGIAHGTAVNRKYSSIEMFTSNSMISRSTIKRRIIGDNLIPYLCGICSAPPVWNGQPMTLILDHKNGIRNDHRIENLRFICPNCNSQTDTFGGRNITRPKEKPAKITRETLGLSRIRQEKIIWPNNKELLKRLETTSFLGLARELGVSDNAIRKRLRTHL